MRLLAVSFLPSVRRPRFTPAGGGATVQFQVLWRRGGSAESGSPGVCFRIGPDSCGWARRMGCSAMTAASSPHSGAPTACRPRSIDSLHEAVDGTLWVGTPHWAWRVAMATRFEPVALGVAARVLGTGGDCLRRRRSSVRGHRTRSCGRDATSAGVEIQADGSAAGTSGGRTGDRGVRGFHGRGLVRMRPSDLCHLKGACRVLRPRTMPKACRRNAGKPSSRTWKATSGCAASTNWPCGRQLRTAFSFARGSLRPRPTPFRRWRSTRRASCWSPPNTVWRGKRSGLGDCRRGARAGHQRYFRCPAGPRGIHLAGPAGIGTGALAGLQTSGKAGMRTKDSAGNRSGPLPATAPASCGPARNSG